jgi:glycosyltransferase
MFFTIITLVKNSMPYLKNNIISINNQKFKNYEHLLVYTRSKDCSLKFIQKNLVKNRKLIFYDSNNVYKAINYAINKSRGKYVILLHSDDFFYNNKVLKVLHNHIMINRSDVVYGNILFVKRNNISKKIRYWSPGNLFNYKIYTGWMPPHTSLVVKKKIFKIIGFYSKKYLISSDYDFTIKLFLKKGIKISYLNKTFTYMRYGGLSTKSSKILIKIKEDLLITYNFFYLLGPLVYLFKIIRKIPQFLITLK